MLAELVRNACLPMATLTGLSLSPVATPFTPATNSTYCSAIVATGGKFCVNDTSFATPVTAQKIAVTQNERTLLSTAGLTFLTNYNSLASLCSTKITTANVGKKIDNNIIITTAMVEKCGNLTSILPTVQSVATSLTASNGAAFTGCYNFFWQTANGAFCLLATDAATNFTTVSGNTVTVMAGVSVAARAFASCSSLYFATCLANDMSSFLDTLTGNVTASVAVRQSCGNSTILATYVNATAIYPDAVQQSLFNQFFTPATITLGSKFPTTIVTSLGYIQRATIARLLQAVSSAISVTTVYTTSANGYTVDTATTGLSTNSTNTNVSNTNNSNVPKGSNYFIAPFFMALLALLIN